MNHRYRVLIEQNKQIIYDSRILDIASHDGRWSFAAIKNGARHVLGIEGRKKHVNNCKANFKYNIEKDRYTFVHGDVHTELPKIGAIPVHGDAQAKSSKFH